MKAATAVIDRHALRHNLQQFGVWHRKAGWWLL